MISKKERVKQVVRLLLIVIGLSWGWRWLVPALTSPETKLWVEKLGIFGPLVVIGYTAVSHVLAPVAGTPGILLGLAVYGVFKASLYVYLGSLLSAIINFYISRQFGRKWVTRLVGKKEIARVDELVAVSGTKLLILSRIFGFTFYELVSYAFGLTQMKFNKYFLITATFSLIPSFLIIYLFQEADFTSLTVMGAWMSLLVLSGIVFSFWLSRSFKKRA